MTVKDEKLWVENRLAEIYHEMKENLGFSLRRTAWHSGTNGDEFCIYDPVARWTSQVPRLEGSPCMHKDFVSEVAR